MPKCKTVALVAYSKCNKAVIFNFFNKFILNKSVKDLCQDAQALVIFPKCNETLLAVISNIVFYKNDLNVFVFQKVMSIALVSYSKYNEVFIGNYF